ncbi:hypothetical protein KA078_02140 [Candidatus Woesebacteria bacterium]|nr:hypothetical protein [Candidatus Woesebacteria bacterium]
MRTYIEKQPSKFPSITVEKLIQSVKGRFIGESPASSRRAEMQDLGAISAANTPLEKLLPLGEPMVESQIAVITPSQIEQLFKQSDELIQAGQLSADAVAAAIEIAQAGILTADEAATCDTTLLAEKSGREFLFPISREWRNLVGVFIALLFVLSMVSAACAAGDSTAPDAGRITGQPTFFVDTPQPPLDGGEGETPAPAEVAPRQICVFDSARNLRTGPSATAPKTTLDGASTTVAGEEYECLETVTNADKSFWVRIGDGVWAVLELQGSGLTGTIEEKIPTSAEKAPIEAQESISGTASVKATQELTDTAPITATGTIGLPSPDAPVVEQVEQKITLSPEEYTRALFPENLEEYFAQQGKDVVFDEKYNIFFSVNKKTKERLALFPHAAANDSEQDLAMSESFFDPKQSCLSDSEVSAFNPNGVPRTICVFVSKQHPIISSHVYFHPDILRQMDSALADIAGYIFKDDQEKMQSSPFTLYLNLAAQENREYEERDFEKLNPEDQIQSLYEEWGMGGLVYPGDPRIRVDIIPDATDENPITVMNAFQNLGDLPSSVSQAQLALLQYITPIKPFWLALQLGRDRINGESVRTFPDPALEKLGDQIKGYRTDKNAFIGGSKAWPDYLDRLAALR